MGLDMTESEEPNEEAIVHEVILGRRLNRGALPPADEIGDPVAQNGGQGQEQNGSGRPSIITNGGPLDPGDKKVIYYPRSSNSPGSL